MVSTFAGGFFEEVDRGGEKVDEEDQNVYNTRCSNRILEYMYTLRRKYVRRKRDPRILLIIF